MKKEEFYYDSRDGESKIYAVRYLPDEGEIKGVLQIIHGMAEHLERYEPFAEYMTGKGFVVTGEEHLGHGHSVSATGHLGYFCAQDPATVVVRDVHRLKKMTQELYPELPYVVLGHSMGSFILRNYLCRYGSGIHAAIIMGTGMLPKALVKTSAILAGVQRVFFGGRHKAKLINQLAFGAYNKKIPNAKTKNDWLTRDAAIVERYEQDPLCGFLFSVNGFQTLFELILRLYKPENLAKIPKDLPIFIVSGDQDPVGEYGIGPEKARQSLVAAGLVDISIKLYENDRHEILNELDRDQVNEDIYSWILKKI